MVNTARSKLASRSAGISFIELFVTKYIRINIAEVIRASTNTVELKNQTSLMEERAQKTLFRANASERSADMRIKLLNIVRGTVGQVRIFTVAPEIFDGIKFWTITGELNDPDLATMSMEELFKEFGLMNRPTIPDENTLSSPKTSAKGFQEWKNVSGSEILGTETKTEVEILTLGRYADRTDTRDSRMLLGLEKSWGLALDRPSASENWLQHEAALVNKDDLLFFPDWPLALSSANLSFETPLLPWDSVPAELSAASDNSIPSVALSSTRDSDGILSQNSSRSLSRSAPASTSDPNSRVPAALSTITSPASFSSSGSTHFFGSDGALLSTLSDHASLPSIANNTLSIPSLPAPRLSALPSALALSASSLTVFVSLVLLGCHSPYIIWNLLFE